MSRSFSRNTNRSRSCGARCTRPIPMIDLSHHTATRAAAVLVPIVQREGDLHLVFIRRSDSVESHRGQVAFPGGRVDPTDATLLDTALREAHEEVGIDPHLVDVLGGFPTMSTVSSGMRVAPFVGLLKRPVEYRIQQVEVAEVFEVPLRVLARPALSRALRMASRQGSSVVEFPGHLLRRSDDLGPYATHHRKPARHHGESNARSRSRRKNRDASGHSPRVRPYVRSQSVASRF